MPTILTHPVVPIAVRVALGSKAVPNRLLVAGMIVSVLPDLDVLAFRFGVAYADEFGHRGFSHSLLAAAVVATVAACLYRWFGAGLRLTWMFLFVSMASHGVLDAFTTGGEGVAFFWPWSDERYFAPWQVIRVSSLGVARFFSHRGGAVLKSELLWVWLPFMGAAGAYALWRHLHAWRRSQRRN